MTYAEYMDRRNALSRAMWLPPAFAGAGSEPAANFDELQCELAALDAKWEAICAERRKADNAEREPVDAERAAVYGGDVNNPRGLGS